MDENAADVENLLGTSAMSTVSGILARRKYSTSTSYRRQRATRAETLMSCSVLPIRHLTGVEKVETGRVSIITILLKICLKRINRKGIFFLFFNFFLSGSIIKICIKVKPVIYLNYFQAMGFILSLLFIFGLTLSTAASMSRSLWLSSWSNDQLPSSANVSLPVTVRLTVYAGIGFLEGFSASKRISLPWVERFPIQIQKSRRKEKIRGFPTPDFYASAI